MQAVRSPSRRILACAVSNAVMQLGVNRSLAPRNGDPKIPFLLLEFDKMLVMKKIIMIEFLTVIPNNVTKPIIAQTDK